MPVGYLGPDHDAVLVGGALHPLVVWIVSESDEVGIQVFEVTEDGCHVFVGVGAASANRRFGVHVGALQEDCFAVEEDACAVDADVAEADVVGELVGPGSQSYFVELGRFGRPEG